MALVLPSTVEELNQLQNSMDIPSPMSRLPMYTKVSKGFENISVERRYKREVSLPNGVENWNIGNFDPYLNFEDNLEEFKVVDYLEDRLVPEEGDQRPRCDSFSSTMSMSMDDRKPGGYQNYGVKTFNTVCMDSGSTCISSDHSYVSPSSSLYKGFEAEETYQNLDMFLQQVPEVNMNDNLPSPLSSTDSNFELINIQSSLSLHNAYSQDSLLEKPSLKRAAETSSDDEISSMKAARLEDIQPTYTDIRRKNNVASKTCRKTRKEKQKEMEIRVADLEKEKEGLKIEVQLLEELINAHKLQLYAILQKR